MLEEIRPALLILGYVNVDIIARVEQLPADGDRVTASRIESIPGGMAANCGCAAAAQGGNTIFFGAVGNDAFAQIVLNDFRTYGVDTNWIFHKAPHTTKAIITVTGGGERTIISESTVYYPEPLQEYLNGFRGRPGMLYVDGYHLSVALAQIRYAKRKGFGIYCDLDGSVDTYAISNILGSLQYVDVVQWNRKISHKMFPTLSANEANQELLKWVGIVIHTDGARTVQVFSANETLEFDVPSIDGVVDTTGAGDMFAGTFIYYYSFGSSLSEAVQQAIDVASRSTTFSGARASLQPQ
jgi:ribokinase